MKLVNADFSGRKDQESRFYYSGGPRKLVQACLRKIEKAVFSTESPVKLALWRCFEARAGLFKCQERLRKPFSQLRWSHGSLFKS